MQFEKLVKERKKIIVEYLLKNGAFARKGLIDDDIITAVACEHLAEIGIIEIFEAQDKVNNWRCKGVRLKHFSPEKPIRPHPFCSDEFCW